VPSVHQRPRLAGSPDRGARRVHASAAWRVVRHLRAGGALARGARPVRSAAGPALRKTRRAGLRQGRSRCRDFGTGFRVRARAKSSTPARSASGRAWDVVDWNLPSATTLRPLRSFRSRPALGGNRRVRSRTLFGQLVSLEQARSWSTAGVIPPATVPSALTTSHCKLRPLSMPRKIRTVNWLVRRLSKLRSTILQNRFRRTNAHVPSAP